MAAKKEQTLRTRKAKAIEKSPRDACTPSRRRLSFREYSVAQLDNRFQ
jgi:hypothetical protein